MVRAARPGRAFRYYRIEDGNHVDGLYDAHPDRLRPILPCFRAAFAAHGGLDRRAPAAAQRHAAQAGLAGTSPTPAR